MNYIHLCMEERCRLRKYYAARLGNTYIGADGANAHISDESTQVLPSALLRCTTLRNVRYASLYAFIDGFYPSFQPYFFFAFLPCAFLILLPKYGKRAPFRTRVRMTAICLILPKSYLRECWTCCRSISPIRPHSRRRLCSYSLRLHRTA